MIIDLNLAEPNSMPCPGTEYDHIYLWLSLAYILVVVLFLWVRLIHRNETKPQFLLLFAILVGPPLWFMFQFNHMYLVGVPEGKRGGAVCESFKYNQDLAAKLWAGVTAFVFAVAYDKKPRVP
jgi:RsiW-degrading membrane proteinase PrsW (M82 family)